MSADAVERTNGKAVVARTGSGGGRYFFWLCGLHWSRGLMAGRICRVEFPRSLGALRIGSAKFSPLPQQLLHPSLASRKFVLAHGRNAEPRAQCRRPNEVCGHDTKRKSHDLSASARTRGVLSRFSFFILSHLLRNNNSQRNATAYRKLIEDPKKEYRTHVIHHIWRM
ncbi:uncharacterized protein LOC105834394 [Monomorium pharaonis]|uniref:uncharacterized protein LOC105834394 n=1 Tax=Monomorium pharaonis TaxID=307658 RepID=UPI00174778E5|nr:uncharacterized protein LOC105834394 [Monomorium pharaonis]